jgi:putative lipoprotein
VTFCNFSIFSPANVKNLIFCFFLFLLLHQISHAENESQISFLNEEGKSDTSKTSDRWLAWDKVEHFGVSAYLSAVSYKIYHDFYHNHKESSLYFSFSLTFSLGLGKEVYDEKRPNGKFSYKDLVADILGIGVGLWIATR